MRTRFGWALVVGCMLSATVGCARNDGTRTADDPDSPRRANAAAAHAETGTNRAAVRAIATARCEREARCNNLGADAKYPSKEDCLDRVRADWAKELSVYECPNGLVSAELDECLEDIRNEDCGSPFDTLARTMSCSQSEICADD